jgi:limonene-1,2-epoxide hydrolase
MSTAEDVVNRFTALWPRPDMNELVKLFADDAVYHNIPIDPVVGVNNIRAHIESFFETLESIDFVVHHQVAAEGLVLNERTDVLHAKDGTTLPLPVAGVFEVRDGKITAWRDYYDFATSTGQSNTAGLGAPSA